MQIGLLLTGDELINGDTLDSNSAMIAQILLPLGASIIQKITVGDDLSQLIKILQYQQRTLPILIINGGLGPTDDDLTVQAISEAFNLPLEIHPDAEQALYAWGNRKNISIDKINLKQAYLPKNAEIIRNPIGSAPGFFLEIENCLFEKCLLIVTPGVPRELSMMLQQEIVPRLQQKFSFPKQAILKKLQFFGLGESQLQAYLNKLDLIKKNEISVGFRAHSPYVELKIWADASHQAYLDKCMVEIKSKIGNYLIGENKCSLATELVRLLKTKNQEITFAESCTGGLISSLLCQAPGASDVFQAGITSYSNTIKQKLLQVPKYTLEEHGAVSEPAVKQMALGAMELSGAKYSIAVSGIAGPTGATKNKPVGSLWIAWGDNNQLKTQSFCLRNQNRQDFQRLAANIAMDLMRRFLLEINEAPLYLTHYKN